MPSKPFAEAAEQNRDDILAVLRQTLKQNSTVLEIGSGTGQHAVHFAKHLPHITWQCSDKHTMLAGIELWINDANLPNLPAAIELDVNDSWPKQKYSAAFAANIAHIMHWQDIEALFTGLTTTLKTDAIFCLYGPFNIEGHYTSASNQRFDDWLKKRDPLSGLKDKAELDQLALKHGFKAKQSWDMPANNKILVWTK